MIDITADLNEARLAGTLAFLDTGAGNAAIQIYGGARPGSVNNAPGSPMLVSIPLTKPAGLISGGLLSLTQQEDGLILTSGIATWARVVNGNGATAFDCDAGQGPGAWEVQLVQVQLFAGGGARLVSAVLG